MGTASGLGVLLLGLGDAVRLGVVLLLRRVLVEPLLDVAALDALLRREIIGAEGLVVGSGAAHARPVTGPASVKQDGGLTVEVNGRAPWPPGYLGACRHSHRSTTTSSVGRSA